MRLVAGATGAAAAVRLGPVPPPPRRVPEAVEPRARAPWPRCRAPSAAPSRSRSTGKPSPRRGARVPEAAAASARGLSLVPTVLSHPGCFPEQPRAPPPQPRVARAAPRRSDRWRGRESAVRAQSHRARWRAPGLVLQIAPSFQLGEKGKEASG